MQRAGAAALRPAVPSEDLAEHRLEVRADRRQRAVVAMVEHDQVGWGARRGERRGGALHADRNVEDAGDELGVGDQRLVEAASAKHRREPLKSR